MLLLFVLIFLIFIASYSLFFRTGSFYLDFTCLCLFYVTFFFLLPAHLAFEQGYYCYVNRCYDFGESDYNFISYSFLLFFLGFAFFLVLANTLKNKMNEEETVNLNFESKYELTFLFWLMLACSFIYFLYSALDSHAIQEVYAVRSGQASGSWAAHLLRTALYSVLIIAAIAAANVSRLLSVFIFLCFSVVLLLSSSGRASLMLPLVLGFVALTGMKTRNVIFILCIITPILMPLILNMKAIIYEISVYRSIPSLTEFYRIDSFYHAYMMNFGHPFVSFHQASDVVQNIGFRYFYDLIQGPIFYLRVIGFSIGDSLAYFNTFNLLGLQQSIIPPGYLAFGYIQASLLGVLLSGALYFSVGVVSRSTLLKSPLRLNSVSRFYLIYLAASSFYHGETRIMVITFVLPLILFSVLPRVFLKKSQV